MRVVRDVRLAHFAREPGAATQNVVPLLLSLLMLASNTSLFQIYHVNLATRSCASPVVASRQLADNGESGPIIQKQGSLATTKDAPESLLQRVRGEMTRYPESRGPIFIPPCACVTKEPSSQ